MKKHHVLVQNTGCDFVLSSVILTQHPYKIREQQTMNNTHMQQSKLNYTSWLSTFQQKHHMDFVF